MSSLLRKVSDQAKQIEELKKSQDSLMEISRSNIQIDEQQQVQTTTMNSNAEFSLESELSWNQTQNQQVFQELPVFTSGQFSHRDSASHFRPPNRRRNSANRRPRNPSRRETTESRPVVLIGDSIIKHVDPHKLSQKTVRKFTYPGKTADEIADCFNTINVENPSHVVIHAGTNNLPSDSADACTSKIQNLVEKAKSKFPNSKIGVSGLTYREDVDLESKRSQVNDRLKQSAEAGGFTFIEHSNIDITGLNGSKLHLNAKGTALLATQVIRFLRKDSNYKKRRRSDFRISSIQELGHLLLNLGQSRPWNSRNYHQ